MSTSIAKQQSGTESAVDNRSAKISRSALTALVIGSMIGGGIFGLPSQMAEVAAPGPLIIGWVITGVGMFMLAKTYQVLALKRPHIEAGVYGYAKEGFGSYIGFSSAWGYWVSGWMGNVSYLVLLMSAVGVFLPGFGKGNTPLAIAVASVILWCYHILILRGIREASVINTVVTVAKITPLVVFGIAAAIAFNAETFSADFWGESTDLGSAISQIKAMMLVTVWVFIGVEGASVFSQRAKSRSDVGKATIIGFASVLGLLLLINLLSYGVVARSNLAALPDPSLGGVLTAAVGPWGAKFIAGGLIITLLGSLLAWFLMCAEILRVPANDGVLPSWLGRENKHSTPVIAMWLTTSMVQLMLLWAGIGGAGYTDLILLASALILLPYVFSAVFYLVDSLRSHRRIAYKDVFIGSLASIYAVWLLYAAGPKYLLFVGLFYLPGTPLYVAARRKAGKRAFTPAEVGILVLFGAASAYALYGLATGRLSI